MGIGKGLAARGDAALEEGIGELLELGAGKGLREVLGHTVHRHDIREVNLCGGLAGELNLGLFSGLFQTLERHGVLLEINAAILGGKLCGQPVDDDLVKVVTAQMGVTVGGEHLEHAVTQLEDTDIESTAAKVVHSHLHVLVFLVQTVSQGGCGGLIDDTLHIQASNTTGLFGGLALGVREVSGHGNHGLGHFLTEIFLGGLFHLLENHGRNLLRRIKLAVDIHARSVVFAADHFVRHAVHLGVHLIIGLTHETLDAEHGVVGVGDSLTLGRGADFTLTAFGESHHGGSSTLPLVVNDNGGLVALHYSHARVGGS